MGHPGREDVAAKSSAPDGYLGRVAAGLCFECAKPYGVAPQERHLLPRVDHGDRCEFLAPCGHAVLGIKKGSQLAKTYGLTEGPPTLRVSFEGGKYEVVQDPSGRVEALCHGRPWWKPDVGQKFLVGVACDVLALRRLAAAGDCFARRPRGTDVRAGLIAAFDAARAEARGFADVERDLETQEQ